MIGQIVKSNQMLWSAIQRVPAQLNPRNGREKKENCDEKGWQRMVEH